MKKHTWRKIILITALCLCCLAAAVYGGINLFVVAKSNPYILTQEEAADYSADCILVLGARVYENGELSAMLSDRVAGGVALYQKQVSNRIVMSGDHGQDPYDEVNAMKKAAVESGVAADDIFMDHAGFSTYESMYRLRTVFEAKKVIIVTQKYHINRAVYIARSLGLEAYGVAADQQKYAFMLRNHVRESLARVKDFGMCIFQPEPTYLGDTIPLSGKGSQTDDGNTQV